MKRHVYRANPLIMIGLPLISFLATSVLIVILDVLWIAFLFLPIPLLVVFVTLKNKIIIEDGRLRHESLGSGREMKVAEITEIHLDKGLNWQSHDVMRQESEGKAIMYVYVKDTNGHPAITFTYGIIGESRWNHFQQQIQAINPNVRFT